MTGEEIRSADETVVFSANEITKKVLSALAWGSRRICEEG
jgi:hypothetical protein